MMQYSQKGLFKIAFVSTHPVQYNAPLFKLLYQRGKVDMKVFYTWGEKVLEKKYDPGFGKVIEWDLPLLEDYPFQFVENISNDPGSHSYKGIDNPSLINDIRSWRPDAVLVYGWSYKSHLAVMRYFKGKVPVWFRGDSINNSEKPTIKNFARKIFLQWVYRHVDIALYVGSRNKDYFVKAGIPVTRLKFAPHAIDNDRFMSNEIEHRQSAQEKRQEMGIGVTDMVFLYAGKLDGNKNVKTLIEAFCKLNAAGIHLLIAGNGTEENALKLQSSENPRIHFMSFQNQQFMPVLYRMADVFVLPSFSETWGLGINEAMACGLAIIASKNAGAAPDLVKEGKNGFSFDPGNSNALLTCLEHLADPVKHRAFGNESRSIISGWNYTADCEAIESLIPTIA